MDDPLINQQISGYRVIKKLGEGGMGAVYLAKGRGPEVVLKTIRHDLDLDGQLVRRFMREAEVTKKLIHKNIVKVIEFGRDNRNHYFFIAMEYVEGGNLLDYISARAGVTTNNIIHILRQVAPGLDFAHQQNVIHRDLKPENILMTSQGEPKIADFGLAKANDNYRLTGWGAQMMGTLYYMPPEQIGTAGRVTYKADLYSLAVIAYLLLFRQFPYPFEGMGLTEIIACVTAANPRLPREIDPGYPVELDDVMRVALAKSPDARYPSAVEFIDDLERALSGIDILHKPPSLEIESKPVSEEEIRMWSSQGRRGAGNQAEVEAIVLLGLSITGAVYRGLEDLTEAYRQRLDYQEQVRVYKQLGNLVAGELNVSEAEGFLLVVQLTNDGGESVLKRMRSDVMLPVLAYSIADIQKFILRIQVSYHYDGSFSQVPSEIEVYFLGGVERRQPMRRVMKAELPWGSVPADIRSFMMHQRRDLKFQIYPMEG